MYPYEKGSLTHASPLGLRQDLNLECWIAPHRKSRLPCQSWWGLTVHHLRKASSISVLTVVFWGVLWADSLSPPAWARETFILGVLGPWDCDPIFAQALPSTAAQLAVDRVNQDAFLLLGSHLDFKVIPTGCNTPHALATFVAHKNTVAAFVGPVNPGYCPAAALLAQGWGKSLFSWACGAPEGGGELVPTLPSAVHVLLSVMRYFGWARLAIVSSHQDIWLATAQQLAAAFRAHGLSIGLVTSLGPGEKAATEVCKQLHSVRGLKSKYAWVHPGRHMATRRPCLPVRLSTCQVSILAEGFLWQPRESEELVPGIGRSSGS